MGVVLLVQVKLMLVQGCHLLDIEGLTGVSVTHMPEQSVQRTVVEGLVGRVLVMSELTKRYLRRM